MQSKEEIALLWEREGYLLFDSGYSSMYLNFSIFSSASEISGNRKFP
jgi:hypothetical protein